MSIKVITILKTVLAFLSLLLTAETADARIFKWVDKDGATHYSEKAPAGQQQMEIPYVPVLEKNKSDDSAEKIMQQLEYKARADKASQEQEAAERATNTKQTNCAKASHNLNILHMQRPIFTKNENGEKIYMEDTARAAEIEKMEKIVAANCEAR